MSTFMGTEVSDFIRGTSQHDTIRGFGGNDTLIGLGGDDAMEGAAGDDQINAGAGNDTIYGGDGRDEILGEDGQDTIKSGNASDYVHGGTGDDIVDGGSGDDSLYGDDGDDVLTGGDGSNYLDGGSGSDLYVPGAGKDIFNTQFDSSDFLSYKNSPEGVTMSTDGSSGSGGYATGDRVISRGYIALEGSAYDDDLTGGSGRAWLSGGAGNDRLESFGSQSTLLGGDGNDVLVSRAGSDELNGGNGVDWVYYWVSWGGVAVNLETGNGSGADATGDRLVSIENIYGSVNSDILTGSRYTNVLFGTTGADALTGGGANDYFLYRAVKDSTVAAAGRDTITDFSHAQSDKIDLRPIDADGNATNGNTDFVFSPGGAFIGSGHEVIVQGGGGVYTVLADVNGDKVADMGIAVYSATALVAGDFML